MKVDYVAGKPKAQRADYLILPVFEQKKDPLGPVAEVDRATRGLLRRRADSEHFVGKKDQQLSADATGVGAKRIVLYGLGKKEKFTTEVFRRAVAKVVSAAGKANVGTIACVLPVDAPVSADALVRAGAEGALLGSYRFSKYKSKDNGSSLKAVTFSGSAPKSKEITQALRYAGWAADATNFARDLVNEPAGSQPPSELSRAALELKSESIDVKVYTGKALEQLNARALLAVSAGSLEPPQLIEMVYRPRGKDTGRRRIAVVGKGLTFDSGGLSIKPADGMMTMKCDMAGAAAVLGLFRALSRLQPDVEVVGIIGATENMPGNRAQKPGDVIRTMSGKTIEVLNTDAEGRLVLADALHYAITKHKPDVVIDLATLTGAVVVGLGDWYAGAMGTDEDLLQSILAAARRADEKFWPLPLDDDMRGKIDSDIADVKNISGDRWGGSITAGLFLREFVGDTPWVHLDIAGPAFAEKLPPIGPKGGTGFGVRTLMEFVRTAGGVR